MKNPFDKPHIRAFLVLFAQNEAIENFLRVPQYFFTLTINELVAENLYYEFTFHTAPGRFDVSLKKWDCKL